MAHREPEVSADPRQSVVAQAQEHVADWTRKPFVTSTNLKRDGIASYSTLDREEERGVLVPYGRRGGRGVRVYETSAVLAWLRGDSAPATAPRPAPPVRRAAPGGDALERIARVAAGGAK